MFCVDIYINVLCGYLYKCFVWIFIYYIHMYIHLLKCLFGSFLSTAMSHTKAVQKIKTPNLGSIFFFSENRAVFLVNLWKFSRARQATEDSVAHALCMLDNKVKNTLTHTCDVVHTPFPLQLRLRERASVLRYTYIAPRYISILHPTIQ